MKMFAESVGLVKAQLGLQSRATASLLEEE